MQKMRLPDGAEGGAAFDKSRCDLGIRAACERFDELGLTMLERWWVCHVLAESSAAIMGDGFSEVAAKLDARGPSSEEGPS